MSIELARETGGLFVPPEVWEDYRLNTRQKLLYAELLARGGPSTPERRDALRLLFGCTGKRLVEDLVELRRLGYVVPEGVP